MVQINFALKEVNCKIVYYGPGLSGKTTNLEIVHKKAPRENKGDLTSIATEGDRTLFFDFMPLDLGTISGMRTKFQLYTVPGQVYYNSTRKLVLQGVDGIVFVADSSKEKLEENLESMENLKANLREYGRNLADIPMALQYNKRDLKDRMEIEDLQSKLNEYKVPYFEAIATTGEGIFPTLKALSAMVLESLNKSDGRCQDDVSREMGVSEERSQRENASASQNQQRSQAAGGEEGSVGTKTSTGTATAARANQARQKMHPAAPGDSVPPKPPESSKQRPGAKSHGRLYIDPQKMKKEKDGKGFYLLLGVLFICAVVIFYLILTG